MQTVSNLYDFVCVEVLQPSQPIGAMSSADSSLGRLSPLSGEPVLCTFFRQKQFAWNVESCFLEKNYKNSINLLSAEFAHIVVNFINPCPAEPGYTLPLQTV